MFCVLVLCGSVLAVATAVGEHDALADPTDGLVIEDLNAPHVPVTKLEPGDVVLGGFPDLIPPGLLQRKKSTTTRKERRSTNDENSALDDAKDGLMTEDQNESYVSLRQNQIESGDLVIDRVEDFGLPGGVQRNKRTTARTDLRWTNGIIPYEIDTNYFTPTEVGFIEGFMQQWQAITCVTFRPATSSDVNKIRYQAGSFGECSSYVGMIGGTQGIFLDPGCFGELGIVPHEIAHAMGLYHEQRRPDRDEYVKVIAENVIPEFLHNFDKLAENQVMETNLPYDYRSLMHYGPKDFSRNEENTLETVDPTYQNLIGQRVFVTGNDILTVRKMYNCDPPLNLSG